MIHVPFIPSAPSTSAHPKRARGALRPPGRLAVAIAVVGLGGCGIFGPTTDRRVIGAIDFDDRPLPEIPETATAGVPVKMTIWTVGAGGCHYSQGETDVAVTGPIAEVTPFDYVKEADVCFRPWRHFEHKATVVFQEPGTAAIVLVYSDFWENRHKGDRRKVYTVEVSPAD